jgi:hypothetical protein
MAAFGRRCDLAAVDVVEQRLTETGAGCDDPDVALRRRRALLKDVQLIVFENRHGVGQGLQIVQQVNPSKAERSSERARVDVPRDVRQVHGVIDDRTGGAEARSRHVRCRNSAAVKKCVDD